MSGYEWTDDALCATYWSDAPWVGSRHVDPVLRAICIHACPVRRHCALLALGIAEHGRVKVVGLWAGVHLPHTRGREEALAELRRIVERGSATDCGPGSHRVTGEVSAVAGGHSVSRVSI